MTQIKGRKSSSYAQRLVQTHYSHHMLSQVHGKKRALPVQAIWEELYEDSKSVQRSTSPRWQ
jgi:hypothetical protein